MPELLSTVVADRLTVRPGESVRVTAALVPEHAGGIVAIAGLRGAEHVLQAPDAPGPWQVLVSAGSDGAIEQRLVTITVQEGGTPLPRLVLEQDQYAATSVLLAAVEPQGLHHLVDQTTYAWEAGSLRATTTAPSWAVDLATQVDDTRLFTIVPLRLTITSPGAAADAPPVVVERTATVWSAYQLIRQTGTVRPPITSSGEARRTIEGEDRTFVGHYAIRNLEAVDVLLTTRQIAWMTDGDDIAGPIEAVAFSVPAGGSFDGEHRFDPAQAPDGAIGATLHLHGTAGELPAHTSVDFEFVTISRPIFFDRLFLEEVELRPDLLELVARLRDLGQETINVGATRTLDEGMLRNLQRSVQVDALAQVQDLAVWQLESPLELTDLIADEGLVVSNDAFAAALRDLGTFSAVRDEGLLFNHQLLQNHALIGPPVEGAVCDPDDRPTGTPEEWACQFTGAWEERWLPGRMMNARKGDLILAPGGDGMIGGLLAQVDPAQRYAHSLICTRNRTEVSHATASPAWLKASHTGSLWSPPFDSEPAPSNGFSPAALKYLWPGGVTQTAEEAFAGSEFTAPDGAKYRIPGFGGPGFAKFGGSFEVIPPLVVKPHPLQETPQIRADLHRVADIVRARCVTGADTAAGRQSQIHYRFFCYTDAGIATRIDPATAAPVGRAPADAGWAAGTDPAVCSSVLWMAARQAGLRLEGPGPMLTAGDLEPDDLTPQAGAAVDAQTPDGLYLYTAEERAAAAAWLYNNLHDDVLTTLEERTGGSAISGLWDLFSDIADDVANQVINTFAFDWSDEDAKDSERWKDEPRLGRAVSPDNLMRWDVPANAGHWGFVEPLVYRKARFEQVPKHAWRLTTGPGVLTGTIRFQGNPAGGAVVSVGGQERTTDGAGRFSLELLEGQYVVDVGMHVPNVGYIEAHQPAQVVFRGSTDMVIDLQEPPDVYRKLVVIGLGSINDDEGWSDDETEDVSFIKELHVQPWGTHAGEHWEQGVGDEVLVDLDFTADLMPDRAVVLKVNGKFWESDDEERTDLDGEGSWEWRIGAGEQQLQSIRLQNDDEDDPGDHAVITLQIRNERQA